MEDSPRPPSCWVPRGVPDIQAELPGACATSLGCGCCSRLGPRVPSLQVRFDHRCSNTFSQRCSSGSHCFGTYCGIIPRPEWPRALEAEWNLHGRFGCGLDPIPMWQSKVTHCQGQMNGSLSAVSASSRESRGTLLQCSRSDVVDCWEFPVD